MAMSPQTQDLMSTLVRIYLPMEEEFLRLKAEVEELAGPQLARLSNMKGPMDRLVESISAALRQAVEEGATVEDLTLCGIPDEMAEAMVGQHSEIRELAALANVLKKVLERQPGRG